MGFLKSSENQSYFFSTWRQECHEPERYQDWASSSDYKVNLHLTVFKNKISLEGKVIFKN